MDALDRSLHARLRETVDLAAFAARIERIVALRDGRTGCACALKHAGVRHDPQSVRVTMERVEASERIVAEALDNALAHGAPRAVEVILDGTPAAICIDVRDDGRGVCPARLAHPIGGGLARMHALAAAVGGTLRIDAPPVGGTVVRLCVPLQRVTDARPG